MSLFPSRLTRRLLAGAAAVLLWPAAAGAQCGNPKTDAERAGCLADELRGADRTINRVYSQLMNSLPGSEQTALRDEQRQWLRTRDRTCGIANSQGDREQWLKALIVDYQKTVCVVRLTFERVGALMEYQRSGFAPKPADSDLIYQIESDVPLSKGKWYFEVTVDEPAVANAGDAALFLGITQKTKAKGAIDESGQASGSLRTLRRIDRTLAKNVYGFAVDLDNGRLYQRENGAWEEGDPGSAGGMDITPGREYVAYLNSSIALNKLIAAKAVVVNVGADPFVYAIPDGYRRFPPPAR